MQVASQNLCSAFEGTIVNVHTVQKWFAKFKNGEYCLEDKSCYGRHSKIDNKGLQNPYSISVNV